jgi:hypothetical protein
MPNFNVDVKIPKDLFLSDKEQLDFVEDAAIEFVEKIRENIRNSKPNGKIYNGHQASAAGQPPAIKTGRLINDIDIDRKGNRVLARFNAPYAGYLEEGTNRIAPRPFVAPILKR